ncbi:MAG: hypothetical protein AB7E72_19130 [Lysobacterales bacterium]
MNKILILALSSLLTCASAAQAQSNAPASRAGINPEPSASSAFLSNVMSSADSCGGVRYSATLTFTGTINDGNGLDVVWFTIYDDMQEKFAQAFSAPVGQTRQFSVSAEYPGGIGAAAPGIAVLVGETRGGGQLINIDPYFPNQIGGCSIGGTAPALAFSPASGLSIPYTSTGTATPIAVSNGGGGSGSGPVATTTLRACTISNGGAAFAVTSFNPGISVIGNASPTPSVLNLPNCVPQSVAVSASLRCIENRGPDGPDINRQWTLACPAGVVLPPPRIQQPSLAVISVTGGFPDAGSGSPILSRNGSKVIFNSDAGNLVSGDSNGRKDVFLRDRTAGTTTRVSAVAEALNAGAQESFNEPSVSPDASTVAFTGSSGQVYASVNGLGRRISASANGTPGNGPSGRSAAPGDGMLVFFESQASNLLNGPDGNGNTRDIFVKDLNSESVILISRGPNDEPADGPSFAPSAAADGQTIVFSTLATNIVPGSSPNPGGFSENFDGVSVPNLPVNWSASNPFAGNGVRWQTISSGTPSAHSAPNSVVVDDEATITDKVLVGPPLRVTAVPFALNFQLFFNVESSFDGVVLEVSVNGGSYMDVTALGGSFSSNGYTGVISQNFFSPIAGRNAWTGNSGGYVPVTLTHPGNAAIATGSQLRFRWRMATDSSVGGVGARLDSITSSNLVLATVQQAVLPRGIKAGTIQQATMMRGGGFGQSRFYLSRNLTSGELGNGDSTNVKITPDGRFGVFQSLATNLINGDSNGVSDIYRFEVANNALVSLERVSVSKTGVQANGASRNATITDDGLFVTFETDATNLADTDNNGASDVMIKSLLTGDVVRQNASSTGQEPNGPSTVPVVSGDGSTIVFGSGATNLSPGDNNNATDIFTAGLTTNAPQDEPSFTGFPLPAAGSAFPSCPGGYFVAAIDDGPGPGLTPGIFGLNLILNPPGTLRLEGGLNFGGSFDGSQAAFAGFNVQNELNEPQRLDLTINGNPANNIAGSLLVRIKVIRQPSAGVNELVFETTTNLSIAQAYTQSLTIQPGFHVVTVAPEGAASVPGGAADGQVYVSLLSQFVNRPGGGFFGGVVVGGYHSAPPFGDNSGFASFCLGTQHSATAQLLSAPTYGASGARDLRLRLLDFQNQTVISVP